MKANSGGSGGHHSFEEPKIKSVLSRISFLRMEEEEEDVGD